MKWIFSSINTSLHKIYSYYVIENHIPIANLDSIKDSTLFRESITLDCIHPYYDIIHINEFVKETEISFSHGNRGRRKSIPDLLSKICSVNISEGIFNSSVTVDSYDK